MVTVNLTTDQVERLLDLLRPTDDPRWPRSAPGADVVLYDLLLRALLDATKVDYLWEPRP